MARLDYWEPVTDLLCKPLPGHAGRSSFEREREPGSGRDSSTAVAGVHFFSMLRIPR